MKVSMSDVGAFLACRRKWHWGSIRNLGLASGYKAEALMLGTGVHAALERFYRGEEGSLDEQLLRWYKETMQGDVDGTPPLSDDALVLGLAMLHGYKDAYGERRDNDPDFIVVRDKAGNGITEQEFCVRIPDTEDDWLIGTCDGLIRKLEGLYGGYWLIDHKTASQFPRRDTLILNQQFLGYSWAFNQLSKMGALESIGIERGTPIKGLLYNGLRKQMPSSRTSAPLFMRAWISFGAAELAAFEYNLRTIVQEMQRGDVGLYPAPGQQCDWCEFQTPCIARQMGEDWEWILANQYEPRPARGIVYEKELKTQ